MPVAALIVPLLLFAAQAAAPPVVIVGHAWAPFISPMGEPFRARTKSDNTLALWFYQADRNRDGLLTPGEMTSDADRFFARLDIDHNGKIEPEELIAYEWEVAPEIQVNSRRRRGPGQVATGSAARRPSGRDDDDELGLMGHGPQGAARYALLNIPEPVAGADADFDRAITAGEFRQAALSRFRLLDRGRQGKLTLSELQALVPPPSKASRRVRRAKDEADSRVGLPLPARD